MDLNDKMILDFKEKIQREAWNEIKKLARVLTKAVFSSRSEEKRTWKELRGLHLLSLEFSSTKVYERYSQQVKKETSNV